MPAKPPRVGPHRDERARKAEIDRRRGSASKRGYDKAWQRVRDAHLQMEPLCQMCREQDGRIVQAKVVDHIIPIVERPDLRLDHDNLRSLCRTHHDRHTAATSGFNRGKQTYTRGSTVTGEPIGANHWNDE